MDSEGTQPSRTGSEIITPPTVSTTRRGGKPRFSSRIFMVGGFIALLLILLLVIIVLPISTYAYYQIYGRVVPGVYIGELELGGLTWQEAREGLDTVYVSDYEVLVSDGSRVWKAKASDFGVWWDTEAMAQQALNVAHGKDFKVEISEMIESISSGWEIEPVLAFDPDIAMTELANWGQTVNVPAQDADVLIENGEVKIISAVVGFSIDIQETLNQLALNPQILIDKGELLFVMQMDQPVIHDVSHVAAEIEGLLASEFVLSAYDPVRNEGYSWEVGRENIASWLELQKSEDGHKVILVDSTIETYARELNSSFGSDQYLEVEGVISAIQNAMDGTVVDPLRVFHHETTYLVKPGDSLLEIGWELGFPYWMIMDANPDLYSNPLEYGRELVIPSRDELMPLPVIPNKRIVISIDDQRLRAYQDGELLWEFIISTGIDDSPTQPGVFQVRTHELNAYASVWDLYMPHFLGVYEAWPEFMNGLHGLPMLSSGRRLWADVLGRPASYGCIILTLEDAETLYYWAEDGVVVEIIR